MPQEDKFKYTNSKIATYTKFIVKKGSDLLSMRIGGGGEQNIAEAFKEAKDKKQYLYLTLRLCCLRVLSRR